MSCECHATEDEHEAEFEREKVIHLAQYEAERRMGYLYHCPECVREARGALAAEQCQLCPSGRHQTCAAHAG